MLEKEEHFPFLFKNVDGLIKELGTAVDNLLADDNFMDKLEK